MPELSRFYGIVVQVYYGDHLPAHFHVEYAGAIAKDIHNQAPGQVCGRLPEGSPKGEMSGSERVK